jgi:hypothetical protein
MSQEFNQSGYTPDPAPETRRNKQNNTWIYITIIVLLLATNIYLFLNRNKMAAEKQQAETEYAVVDSARASVENDYRAALARLDDLVSKNTALNNEINDKDGEIARLKKELQGIMRKRNATAEDLRRARVLIDELNMKARGYEERIAVLEGENKVLTETNTVLARERDSTVVVNENIRRLGSVLHASNIRMHAIDVRRGGKKEVETGKAKRVDVFRIYFDIDENRIAEDGEKELFLRIIGPDGNLLSNSAYGSGITTAANGNSLNYTLQKTIALVREQPVKDVMIDWRQEEGYSKGTYSIEIYNEGYRIGAGNVTLR